MKHVYEKLRKFDQIYQSALIGLSTKTFEFLDYSVSKYIKNPILYYLVKIRVYYKYNILNRYGDIRGFTRPYLILEEILHKNINQVSEQPTPISELEWDNLIILDGCRADVFEEVWPGSNTRITSGSSSREFLESNFSEKEDYSDTIYISANPFTKKEFFKEITSRNIEDVFHDYYNILYNDEYFDSENKTVLPSDIAELAKTIKKLDPDKRLIVHFMQPHFPFIGTELGRGFDRSPGEGHEVETIWEKAEKGELPRGEAYKLYKENLEIAKPYVENLCTELDGKTVVTSDHGNLVGENGFYGHPSGKNAEVLCKVPMEVYE